MATPITMPEAGESVVSGVLSSWLKADGDHVERDDTVAEVETDKITVEILAPAAGALSHSVGEGDEIEIGQAIGAVDETTSGAIAPGGQGNEGAGATVAAPRAAESNAAPEAAPAPADAAKNGTTGTDGARATPLARKLAQEHGVSLAGISGTGAGGRIREQDVLEFVRAAAGSTGVGTQKAAGQQSPGPITTAAAPDRGPRAVTRERMSPLRRKVASRLVEAQQTAAMLTTFNECDMSAVMTLRKQYKDAFAEKHGIGLGFMSFFVKACASALQRFPKVNAFIVDDGGKPAIEMHDYQDIAIAVASPKGLVVPVIRGTESLSFAQIESTIKDMGTRAKNGKLSLEEMQGGTFTITNGGVFGSLLSTPILNPPQSAILGMHGIKKRAVEDPDNPGSIVLRPMMYLAVSYDHRIVDGAEAVQFLVAIKDVIEDPRRLMLEL